MIDREWQCEWMAKTLCVFSLSGCMQVGAMPTGSAEAAMLNAVNNARATARQCGSVSMAVAPRLRWSPTLAQAAMHHSRDQAARNELSHNGSDGSRVNERVTRAGYTWRAVGENVYTASWHASASEAVASWLTSPGHCKNIMSPDFTELGAGLADEGKARYWTQVFAAPRKAQ